ncbi:hypothetical protein PC115_g13950 [Phytophthora cactorum]|uniref:Uncharacterized protein n=1 Tax=Phytophthora cactorum TaxID=29920 RepID=A0A8T1BPL9_9STRA|nr:hypothetical protein PC115_g13950 [Phytophthora cactorum]
MHHCSTVVARYLRAATPSVASWTQEEDVLPCRAYLNVSEDGATGTDQSSTLFWSRIFEAFVLLAGSDGSARSSGALQSRWSSLIRPDVALYVPCLASSKAESHSGWSDADYAAEAGHRFTAKKGEAKCECVGSV